MGEDKKLNLIIQASWENQGVTDAQQDLSKLAQIAQETGKAGAQMGTTVQAGLSAAAEGSAQMAVRMAAMEAKTRETAASLRKLAQDVVAGNKSFDEAESEYAAAEKALEAYRQELGLVEQGLTGVKKEVNETSTAVDQQTKTGSEAKMAWLELSAKINVAQQAYQAIATIAREAYQTVKEGARLEAVTNTFGSLADSIGESANALQNQLRTAVRDTVSDMALMEGANRFVAMGLAANGEEAAELATIASQLGLAFRGDAVAGMEEFALLLANQSIPRLDTFGISAGRVRTRIDELTESVPGMTRETAFMQATMEQARMTMGKIGDQTQGTAGDVARLESAVANISGSMKGEFAQAAAPMVGWLADIAQGFVDTKRAAEDAKGAVEEFIAVEQEAKTLNDYREALLGVQDAIDQVGPIGSPLSPLATVDTRESLLLLLADYGRTANSSDDLRIKMQQMGATISDTGVSVDGMGVSWIELERTIARLNEQDRLDKINQDMGRIDEKLLSYQYSARGATEETRRLTAAVGTMTSYTENNTWSVYEWNSAVGQQQAQAWAAAEAMKRKAEATREASEKEKQALGSYRQELILLREEQERLASITGDYFTTAVNAGENALVTWNRTVSTSGGLTGEQRTNLDELARAYERTHENIRSLQGGVGGLGLSEDELNKKLEEQYAQLGMIEAAMGPLQGITAEVTGVTEGWRYNQEAINSELYKAADAAGASATELALLGLATGQLSEAQAIAALKSAALQEKITELGKAIADGMDPTEALNRLDSFQAGLEAQDFTVRLGIEVEGGAEEKARSKISDIVAKGIPEDDRKIEIVASAEPAELTIAGFVEGFLQPAVDGLYEILLQAETAGAETAVSNLKKTIDQLQDRTVTITVDTVVMGDQNATLPINPDMPVGSYSTGGRVTGGVPGIDSVLARLTPGEIVIPEYAANSMSLAMAFVGKHIGNDRGVNDTDGGEIVIQNYFNVPVTADMLPQIAEAQRGALESARARGRR